MHYDSQSWLAALSQMALGICPSKEQKQPYANALTRWQPQRTKHIDQATQQIVKTELVKLNQQPAQDFFLDLHHCFDYIIETCHILACWQHGATDDYFCLNAQIHCMMRYYVQHCYSISNPPWHSAGQGIANAASGILLSLICSLMHNTPSFNHMFYMAPCWTCTSKEASKHLSTMLPCLQVTSTLLSVKSSAMVEPTCSVFKQCVECTEMLLCFLLVATRQHSILWMAVPDPAAIKIEIDSGHKQPMSQYLQQQMGHREFISQWVNEANGRSCLVSGS